MKNRVALAVSLVSLTLGIPIAAQQRGAPAAAAPGPTPQSTAPFDPTGYWVSVIQEDWRWRMPTPSIGDLDGINLNQRGLQLALAWDYQKDIASGNQCKAYGAGNIMRMPTRLHITWQDPKTLKVEADAGTQTRLFNFDPSKQFVAAPRSWQGISIAQWIDVLGAAGGRGRGAAAADDEAPAPPARGGAGAPPAAAPAAPARGGGGGGGRGGAGGGGRAALAYGTGTLKVVTTNLRSGYVRKNGAPYSDNAVVTEYLDRLPGPNNTQWLIVRTTVDDPTYLAQPLTVSSNFKLEPDGSKWRPTPCEVDPPLIPGDKRRIPFRPGDVETIR